MPVQWNSFSLCIPTNSTGIVTVHTTVSTCLWVPHANSGVNMVIAAEFGLGVSTLLDHHGVTKVAALAGTSVSQSIKFALSKVQK